MNVIDPGHIYNLDNDNTLSFIKREAGQLIYPGTTNEEVLEVLIDRTEFLNLKMWCKENDEALQYLKLALSAFHERTGKRIEQNVETLDIPHVS